MCVVVLVVVVVVVTVLMADRQHSLFEVQGAGVKNIFVLCMCIIMS